MLFFQRFFAAHGCFLVLTFYGIQIETTNKQNLANEIFFLFPAFFFSSKIRFLKDIRRGDNEQNIGSEIKKRGGLGLRSRLFFRFLCSV